jgi:hypothetical protein
MNSPPGVEKILDRSIKQPGRGQLVRRTFIIAIILSKKYLAATD